MPISAGQDIESTPDVDVAIVGAGFAGLYGLYELRRRGYSVTAVEQGGDVGGTWYWNRYPGARCDIESIDYSYSFSPELLAEWKWSERYAAQPEILAYLNHVADRFELRDHIRFNWKVVSARFNEATATWTLTATDGQELTAHYCIFATGNLSQPRMPDIAGLETFEGDWYHTANWPHQPVDLSGRRVGLIGTGSSGIQTATTLAKADLELYVLQRTPSYSVPARNRPLPEEELAEAVANYPARREVCRNSESGVPMPPPTESTFEVTPQERTRRFEAGWKRGGINALSSAFTDHFTDEEANRIAQDFARSMIDAVVRDPDTAAALKPNYHIGTRRTCVDTGYYEIYNQDNVHLVDVHRDPIQRIEKQGVRLNSGLLELDTLVFAVGFDAITGAVAAIDIEGRNGLLLADAWAAGPNTFLGLATAGFPNLFLVTGPGSPSVLSNMVLSIEHDIVWIADCLDWMREEGVLAIEAEPDSQREWMDQVEELAQETLYPKATSWYLGSNVPGKPRKFLPYVAGVGRYREECEAVAKAGYRGFSTVTDASESLVLAGEDA